MRESKTNGLVSDQRLNDSNVADTPSGGENLCVQLNVCLRFRVSNLLLREWSTLGFCQAYRLYERIRFVLVATNKKVSDETCLTNLVRSAA